MLHSESTKKGDKINSSPCYRRPYGVGVLALSSLVTGSMNPEGTLDMEEKEHSFKVIFAIRLKKFWSNNDKLILIPAVVPMRRKRIPSIA